MKARRKLSQRWFAWLLVMVMVFSLLPGTGVQAETTNGSTNGSTAEGGNDDTVTLNVAESPKLEVALAAGQTLPEPVEVHIPLDEEMQGKKNYKIYRYHESGVDTITEDKSQSEYIEVKGEGTALTLYAKKFSAYVIAFDKSDVDIVIGKINAFGTVAYTEAYKAAIDVARNSYNALSDNDKKKVSIEQADAFTQNADTDKSWLPHKDFTLCGSFFSLIFLLKPLYNMWYTYCVSMAVYVNHP